MGISSLPAPSEGFLCIVLVNTALSISIFKGIVRSILHIVGIHLPSSTSSDSMENPSVPIEFHLSSSDSCGDDIQNRIPTMRFDAICSCKRLEHDCPVCLSRFYLDSEVNQLCCGHLFHKVCLERWLDYWNITCPLCRAPLMSEEETSSCIW